MTTAALVPEDATGRARLTQKAPGVIAGLSWPRPCSAAWTRRCAGSPDAREGEWRDGGPWPRWPAASRSILDGRARGAQLPPAPVAASPRSRRATSQAVEGTGARILDTRKTTPGLRALEKQAVLAGGGHNHRVGLYDAILVKENHIAMAGGRRGGHRGARSRRRADGLPVEVECASLDERRARRSRPARRGSCSTT